MSLSTILTLTRGFVRSSAFLVATRFLTLALTLGLASTAWADFQKTNPVTGETESYTWKFVGTDTWNGTGYWQDSSGANPSGVPAKTGEDTWDPILFDGNTININAGMSVEGWNLRMGLYNGASVTMNTFVKFQGGDGVDVMWMTVDDSSQLTIGGFGKGNISANQIIKLSSAKASGIEWLVNLESTGTANNTFEYYLKGDGSVSYQAVSAANHKIKMADVTLSGGAKSVRSKTLVTFISTDKTFTADATIKVMSNDVVVGTEHLAAVNTTGMTTLTADGRVGACELVQTSTGIVLYYVDGSEYAYVPSINVNFTHGTDSDLTTSANVGLAVYAVPGTSWNNMPLSETIQEGEGVLNQVKSTDSTGTASVESGVSVAVSGARGSYYCWNGVAAASDPRHGYVDDGENYQTPTVTVTGVPYDYYRVIVYCATDTADAKFGYVTVNGTDFTYVDGLLAAGTASWGNTGNYGGALAIAKGVNTLVTDVLSGSTATVVGHNMSGARGCIAAIQIVKAEVDADLVIAVTGDTTYTVSENPTYGKVQIVGSGTLTFDGAGTITADTFDVGSFVAVKMGSNIAPVAVIGSGVVVYDGAVPASTTSFADDWTGTVWIKNVTHNGTSSGDGRDFDPNKYGNINSKVKLTGVTCYLKYIATTRPTIVLEDDGDTPALTVDNGYDAQSYILRILSGGGTLKGSGSGGEQQKLVINGFADFTGSIDAGTRSIFISPQTSAQSAWGSVPEVSGRTGVIYVDANATGTIDAAAKWTTAAEGSIVVAGNGELYFSNASSITNTVRGAGKVVRTGITSHGAVGSVLGLTDSENWTGVFEFRNCNMGLWHISTFGNANSTVRLNGVTSYLYGDANSANHNVGTLDVGVNGWIVDGSYKGVTFAIPAKLTGAGTFTVNTSNSSGATENNRNKTFKFTGDVSEFSGILAFGGSTEYTRIVIGETTREFVPKSLAIGGDAVLNVRCDWSDAGLAGGVYVDERGLLDVTFAEGYVHSAVGFAIDGVIKTKEVALAYGSIGPESAPVTINGTGVLELTSAGNKEDYRDYSNVTGTGTIKYSSTAGWRLFPSDGAKMPATTLTIQAELADSLIIACSNETVIGNLAGSKNIRSDWTNNGESGRTLTVTQSKDTEWQGEFVNNRITQFNVVAPAEGDAGTLTLSGTQSATIPFRIGSGAKVNIAGKWVGPVSVEGTIAGSGTIDGELTVSGGATVLVNDAKPPEVTGNVTLSGNIEIAVADDLDASTLTILRVTGDGATLDASEASFTVRNASGKAVLARVVAKSRELRFSKGGFYIHLQ
ncbi:MAG: hypothetical protein IKU71_05910 [Kiritimatiellae bacterium]|nr:hypothetical protein [Kiritimatiellia bacterium]